MIVKPKVFCVFSRLPNQLISIIPKGYHNCQLFIVNYQFTKAPFAHKDPSLLGRALFNSAGR